MSQKKNEGILFPTEIRVVGSYTDRLLNGKQNIQAKQVFIVVCLEFNYIPTWIKETSGYSAPGEKHRF